MVTTGPGRVNLQQHGRDDLGRAGTEPRTRAARLPAQQILFSPLADWLDSCHDDVLPDCTQLNRWLHAVDPHPRVASARPLRFVDADSAERSYEERILSTGEVLTRPQNWHDFFNALVWMRFQRTKAALNALHVHGIRKGGASAGRGPLRDAATQFDESGIIVASADPHLLQLLEERSWKTLFWQRRADVIAQMRFIVFGHGLYDALRAPFYRMCGRAATFVLERRLIESEVAVMCRHLDAMLAERFAEGRCYPRPRSLLALPLLGIPGVTAANESPEYYDDTEQFRPLPSWAA